MRGLGLGSESLRRKFDDDGFVSLPGFLSTAELAELHRELGRFLRQVAPTLPPERVYREDRNDPGSLKQVQCLQDHDPYFHDLMCGSCFEQLARLLLDEPVVGKNLQYFDKPAGSGRGTPAHQDGQFFMLEPCRAVTLWLALEDVGLDQGCLRYVRGSHRLGLRAHGRSGVLGFSQCIADFGGEGDRAREVSMPCRAGQLLAHDALTIHRADANASPERGRPSLGWIYYGVSAREDTAAQAAYQDALAARLTREGRI